MVFFFWLNRLHCLPVLVLLFSVTLFFSSYKGASVPTVRPSSRLKQKNAYAARKSTVAGRLLSSLANERDALHFILAFKIFAWIGTSQKLPRWSLKTKSGKSYRTIFIQERRTESESVQLYVNRQAFNVLACLARQTLEFFTATIFNAKLTNWNVFLYTCSYSKLCPKGLVDFIYIICSRDNLF